MTSYSPIKLVVIHFNQTGSSVMSMTSQTQQLISSSPSSSDSDYQITDATLPPESRSDGAHSNHVSPSPTSPSTSDSVIVTCRSPHEDAVEQQSTVTSSSSDRKSPVDQKSDTISSEIAIQKTIDLKQLPQQSNRKNCNLLTPVSFANKLASFCVVVPARKLTKPINNGPRGIRRFALDNKCDICQKVFASAVSLKIHYRTHTGERPFQCHICNKRFVQSQHLKRHVLTHTQKQIDNAENTSAGSQTLEENFSDSDDDQETSGKQAKTDSRGDTKLKRYARVAADVSSLNTTSATLNRMILPKLKGTSADTGMPSFVVANLASNSTSLVVRSASSTSAGSSRSTTPEFPYERRAKEQKSWVCDVCNRSYATAYKLKIHYRVHTGEKPFTCDICDGSFTQSHHLKRHKLIHTGEKPFQCSICDKKFTRMEHLKAHQCNHS